MPSNYTENYQLSQWERSDKVLMEDFNGDNAKIDAALGGLSKTTETHTGQIAQLGNCQIYTANYVGPADASLITHTFPHKPWFVIVQALEGSGSLLLWRNSGESTDNKYVTFTWDGNTVTWGGPAEQGMRYPGRHYQIIAFLDMSD